MTCFVASETGEVFCRRIYGLPTSNVSESSASDVANITVAPNPASGQVTISVNGLGSAALSGSRLLLYNEVGQLALDLTTSFAANGYRKAVFSAAALPPGLYQCTLTGPDLARHVGVIVVE